MYMRKRSNNVPSAVLCSGRVKFYDNRVNNFGYVTDVLTVKGRGLDDIRISDSQLQTSPSNLIEGLRVLFTLHEARTGGVTGVIEFESALWEERLAFLHLEQTELVCSELFDMMQQGKSIHLDHQLALIQKLQTSPSGETLQLLDWLGAETALVYSIAEGLSPKELVSALKSRPSLANSIVDLWRYRSSEVDAVFANRLGDAEARTLLKSYLAEMKEGCGIAASLIYKLGERTGIEVHEPVLGSCIIKSNLDSSAFIKCLYTLRDGIDESLLKGIGRRIGFSENAHLKIWVELAKLSSPIILAEYKAANPSPPYTFLLRVAEAGDGWFEIVKETLKVNIVGAEESIKQIVGLNLNSRRKQQLIDRVVEQRFSLNILVSIYKFKMVASMDAIKKLKLSVVGLLKHWSTITTLPENVRLSIAPLIVEKWLLLTQVNADSLGLILRLGRNIDRCKWLNVPAAKIEYQFNLNLQGVDVVHLLQGWKPESSRTASGVLSGLFVEYPLLASKTVAILISGGNSLFSGGNSLFSGDKSLFSGDNSIWSEEWIKWLLPKLDIVDEELCRLLTIHYMEGKEEREFKNKVHLLQDSYFTKEIALSTHNLKLEQLERQHKINLANIRADPQVEKVKLIELLVQLGFESAVMSTLSGLDENDVHDFLEKLSVKGELRTSFLDWSQSSGQYQKHWQSLLILASKHVRPHHLNVLASTMTQLGRHFEWTIVIRLVQSGYFNEKSSQSLTHLSEPRSLAAYIAYSLAVSKDRKVGNLKSLTISGLRSRLGTVSRHEEVVGLLSLRRTMPVCEGRDGFVSDKPCNLCEGRYWKKETETTLYWCRGGVCTMPSRHMGLSDSSNWTLIDICEALDLNLHDQDFASFAAYLNRIEEIAPRLVCFECQSLLKPSSVVPGVLGHYGLPLFVCENTQCGQKGKQVRLTHCMNCHHILDSRTHSLCASGWMVCDECLGCCKEHHDEKVCSCSSCGSIVKEWNTGSASCGNCGLRISRNLVKDLKRFHDRPFNYLEKRVER
jgi:hypothetical protein